MLIQLRFWPHDPLWPSSLRMALGQYRAQLHFGSRDPICISGGSCQKNDFCCDKSFVMSNMCLLCVWCDKHVFVAVKQMTKHMFCPNKSMLVVTKKNCHNKHIFVATNICRDKHNSVCLSWHILVVTYICVYVCVLLQQKYSVMTNIILSRQNKHTFVTTNTRLPRQKFCCDKNPTCGSSRQW